MSAALVFDCVSKEYRGARQYRALRDDLAGLVRRRRDGRATVRALDGVSLEVEPGEAFGLIGPNGAGKTTALKLASRISYPTAGEIRVRGRVGALIEVGTGLHPELTGRENVRLYGRILGLRGRDIARRFDEIVDFAGIGGAIDQPVKQFSSGMTLRLGFAIAAHLEPDVLLVDEALAVGDAAFQQQCMRKMSELTERGLTLVLVSHAMEAIETVCSRAALLDHGRVVAEGDAREVIAQYLRAVDEGLVTHTPAETSNVLSIERVTLHDAGGGEVAEATPNVPLTIRLHYVAHEPVARPHFNISIGNGPRRQLFAAAMLYDGQCPELLDGRGAIDCTFAGLPLLPRVYEIWCGVKGEDGVARIFPWAHVRSFRVAGEAKGQGPAAVARGARRPPVDIPYEWSLPPQGGGRG